MRACQAGLRARLPGFARRLSADRRQEGRQKDSQESGAKEGREKGSQEDCRQGLSLALFKSGLLQSAMLQAWPRSGGAFALLDWAS